jgi:hypothetical protein
MTNTYEQAREALREIGSHRENVSPTVNWSMWCTARAQQALAALDAAQGQPPPDVAMLIVEAHEMRSAIRYKRNTFSRDEKEEINSLLRRLASALEASSDRKEVMPPDTKRSDAGTLDPTPAKPPSVNVAAEGEGVHIGRVGVAARVDWSDPRLTAAAVVDTSGWHFDEASSGRLEQPDPTPGQPDTTPQGGPALTESPSTDWVNTADSETVWRVCRAIKGDCKNCPSIEIVGGEDCTRGCYLQAVECVNIVQTGNPWRKTEGVKPPWTVFAPSDDYIRRVIDRFLRFYVHTDPPERAMMTLREAMTEVKP